MDQNKDGVVTLEEFLDCCMRDEDISRSMAVFNSSFWHTPVRNSLPPSLSWRSRTGSMRCSMIPKCVTTLLQNFHCVCPKC